jgi:beta-lactamase superfamily II metal-dependent hydrolase
MPFDPNFDDFVAADTDALYDKPTGGRKIGFVLWGDGVRTLQDDGGARVKLKVRGKSGWLARASLGGTSLLEYYFIDVGQGDGILIKTPDWRHIMIDGGYPRSAQPTGKSAADFVDWKFAKDYGVQTIVLDAMVSSHIDFDHYGGLSDILDVQQVNELDCTKITVEVFYHSGLSHWAKFGTVPEGLGPYVTQGGRKWFTRLLDDRASAVAGTSGAGPQLRGLWAGLIRNILATTTAAGTPTQLARLDQTTGWLPGFGQNSSVPVRVLGPLAGQANGAPTLLRLDSSQSLNTNGTSVLLRIDYGKTRTLMTGDLNAVAHKALLTEYAGREIEFAVDVAKCCHHGSEDVSYSFLHHVNAACTVISSGDAEGHDHPRPRIVAASGLSGHVEIKDDKLLTPLVYSTELARSVEVGLLTGIKASAAAGGASYGPAQLGSLTASYTVTTPGALSSSNKTATLARARLMHKLLYGLVNIRTDGLRILAATMNEGDGSFAVKTFTSRFP